MKDEISTSTGATQGKVRRLTVRRHKDAIEQPGRLKCQNGDTLEDLTKRKEQSDKRVVAAYRELSIAKAALQPIQAEFDNAMSEQSNYACRLRIWWREFEEKQPKLAKRLKPKT